MIPDHVLQMFPEKIKALLKTLSCNFSFLQEIRLRIGRPVILVQGDQEYFLGNTGILTKHVAMAYCISREELLTVLELLSKYSLYAYEEEIGQGFLTVAGGHRAGFSGQVIMDGDRVKGFKNFYSVNIRFAHEVSGCADSVISKITDKGTVLNTLIISPPGFGKTTLLRDLIRQISDGISDFPGCCVGVVDERSEIGGCFQGIPQNNVGMRTDILDGCPKARGMIMLLRTMAPKVIAVDEIGDVEDARAILTVLHGGCRILATIHGSSLDDIKQKPLLQELAMENVFHRYVVLDKNSSGKRELYIYDERGQCIFSVLEK